MERYVPQKSTAYVVELLVLYKIQLRLTKPRKSKYGDYRAPHRSNPTHRITVNKDLNPFNFLITFLHETAHLVAFLNFGHRIEAHGKEWKSEFRELLKPVAHEDIFPPDILSALNSYMNNPSATSCSDSVLSKVLIKYDSDNKMILDEIESGQMFKIDSGQIFIKGKKLRTRYLCKEIPSGREYFVPAISKIELFEGSL